MRSLLGRLSLFNWNIVVNRFERGNVVDLLLGELVWPFLVEARIVNRIVLHG